MLPAYEEDMITSAEARGLEQGDKLVFIDPRTPDQRYGVGANLHETVVTFKHLSRTGDGIEVYECPNTHFFLKCYHRIISEPKIAEEDFNAVFA